ncbi:dolichol-phosphate mannosyltransferase subunit 3 [Suillus subalutaceus]|uniref:dolichol-phosphate mannosyltransferase subunit 3 n=1 Tax=Suillus subalutaceus TaxID=48586 RepID=UPI001B85C971|nr:dolichol-phosphate mannosyltransferase subunit 3 [Suillus subalutaceus]KAG1836983.1 dolichol-phosphate mannosyltransferase subunit 3 [Suillus subalutaceus]
MTRLHRVSIYSSVLISIYLLVLLSVAQEILPVIPWWLLVSLGSYSLWSLGWGMFTFRDCPDAYHELLQEINEAKNDLRSRAVTVD